MNQNYFHIYLWVIAAMGDIAHSMLVNLHKHNSVDPDSIDENINMIIELLQKFKIQYRQKCVDTNFNMER